MTSRTSADAMIDALEADGVDVVFGLPGAQTYPLFDSLARRRDQIRTVGARHEQGSAFMAFGYARSTGRLGVCSVVPGPGLLNAGAAIATALGACAPMLCLTGEVPSDFRGRGRGHLHELPDQLAFLRQITKQAAHVDSPDGAEAATVAAIAAARSGRPGPVALSMCWDTLGQSLTAPDRASSALPVTPTTAVPDARSVDAAAALLMSAKHPMIFTGSGAQHASEEVRRLAELLGAPVVGFRGGRGVVGDDHPLGMSIAAAWNLWPEVDLVLGVGSRMEVPFMRWQGMMSITRRIEGRILVRVDIDPAEMDRLDTDGPVVADAAVGATSLADALSAAGHRPLPVPAEFASAKARAATEIRSVQPEMAYLDAIRAALPRDGFFVEELCQAGFTSYFGFDVYEPRTYVSCGFQGTLGYGFPTALGVKVAHPDRVVVSINGDGGFMFAMPELATAVQERIGVVVVVFDNGGFGNVRRDQQTRFEGRLNGAELVNPDFVALAASFGVAARRVSTPESFRSTLDWAIAKSADTSLPTLICVDTPQKTDVTPWRFIHPVG